jgi:Zn-finger nucleic acid-binding protein
VSAPYRDAAVQVACPRCGETLADNRDRCGEWIAMPDLEGIPLDELGKFDQVKPLRAEPMPATCPLCHHEMEPRFWSDALFDVCALHGVWVDDDHRDPFAARLASIRAREREVDELAERLATPDGRREIARRLIALERRLSRLEVR